MRCCLPCTDSAGIKLPLHPGAASLHASSSACIAAGPAPTSPPACSPACSPARRPQVRTYSGGMKRRLSVAISFIGDPLVVYLDEPSTVSAEGLQCALQRFRSMVKRAATARWHVRGACAEAGEARPAAAPTCSMRIHFSPASLCLRPCASRLQGLDPASRQNLWAMVKAAKQQRGIILTTHRWAAGLSCQAVQLGFGQAEETCQNTPTQLPVRTPQLRLVPVPLRILLLRPPACSLVLTLHRRCPHLLRVMCSMEEATALCDRLGIFVDGALVCVGNPKELTSRYGGYYVRMRFICQACVGLRGTARQHGCVYTGVTPWRAWQSKGCCQWL